jgi:hypothetical protein
VKVTGRQDIVCVIENIMAPMPGEVIKMHGEWTNHPEFVESSGQKAYRGGEASEVLSGSLVLVRLV